MAEAVELKYRAFISYSHAADGKLAPALQRALHVLAKPCFPRRRLTVGLGLNFKKLRESA